ncbi:MAG: rRNA pseudouridine synthase [Clostridia bacterium]|nr:rRNA pseudouridine synthase [Clostridia bacterium]
MRIDKFLTETGTCTRSEAGKAVRRGDVLLNGRAVRSASEQMDPETDTLVFRGEPIVYRKFTYIVLNKPEGVVSATEDGDVTVLDLLPEQLQRLSLFPCGRLDKYTVGFVLLTNNGALAHRLLSPKHHVEKCYRFAARSPLSDEGMARLEAGVDIGGYRTAPCRVEREEDGEYYRITLTEGKYHQIKRMLEAVDNKITFLERISFAGIALPPELSRGEWRYLDENEVKILEDHGKL